MLLKRSPLVVVSKRADQERGAADVVIFVYPSTAKFFIRNFHQFEVVSR